MKVAIISNSAYGFWTFRGDLVNDLVRLNNEVIAIAPESDGSDEVTRYGAEYISVPFKGNRISPIKDLLLILHLRKVMMQHKPSVVLSCTIKPVIYGSIAAKLAGVPHSFSLLTGTGLLFNSNKWHNKLSRFFATRLFKFAFGFNEKVIFQNNDNCESFVSRALLPEQKSVVVDGSGINLARFRPKQLPKKNRFIMIARIVYDKGVQEYFEAASIVKKLYPAAEFQFLGDFVVNPNAIDKDKFYQMVSDAGAEYLGATRDVRPYIEGARIFVLPSYHEGIPHSTLEAMAMKRPIITTNVVGAKETVIDGKTGLLAEARNAQSLAEKMIWMIENPSKCEKMAEQSYRYCVEKYDVNKINDEMLEAMGLERENVGII